MEQEYLQTLKSEIEKRYACRAVHSASCPVAESVEGTRSWKGVVEIFLLIGCLQANRCFAWMDHSREKADSDKIVTVLETPPLASPGLAVRMTLL